MELLLGCGSSRDKKLIYAGREAWDELVTLDHNDAHNPTHVHDLNDPALPFEDDCFDELHAYCVLEHLGRQGDWRFFFDQWSDFWRVLKPGGTFHGICPHPTSPWAWGDPSHTRVLSPENLVFLTQPNYEAQVGVTPMSDFRFAYKADFDLLHCRHDRSSGNFEFVLQAVKPSRIVDVHSRRSERR